MPARKGIGHELSTVSQGHAVLAFEAALVEAQLAGDAVALDRLLDDGLCFTGLGGRVFSKEEDLAAHRSGHIRITKMQQLDRRVVFLGDVAVVSVLMDSEALVEGMPVLAKLRYTRVWHNRHGEWRVVAGHMSIAEDGQPPPGQPLERP